MPETQPTCPCRRANSRATSRSARSRTIRATTGASRAAQPPVVSPIPARAGASAPDAQRHRLRPPRTAKPPLPGRPRGSDTSGPDSRGPVAGSSPSLHLGKFYGPHERKRGCAVCFGPRRREPSAREASVGLASVRQGRPQEDAPRQDRAGAETLGAKRPREREATLRRASGMALGHIAIGDR